VRYPNAFTRYAVVTWYESPHRRERTVAESCPISPDRVDESVVRSTAGFVVVVTAAALLLPSPFRGLLLLALGLDFIARGFGWGAYSPLGLAGRATARSLRFPAHPTDAAPKRFAARVGIVFSLGAAVSFLLGATIAGFVFAAILILAALLESAFALCIGCKVYALLPEPIARTLVRG
jgi:hypothetical protein